jgi:hypothetical protein
LYDDVARQLPSETGSGVIAGNLCLQFGIKDADLAGQEYEMQKHIGVHDQKHKRPQDKEGLERQFDIEKWQFNRAFE